MSESPHVIDVTDETFEAEVIERSRSVPVLVDFWAEWCNPCRMLVPVLTSLAAEYQGAFVLAKVNTDAQQALAARYGVRSLPTVKLFVDGQPVDEFMGALPESEVRRFLQPYLRNPADEVLQAARQAFAEGRDGEALEMLNRALAEHPDNTALKCEIASISLERGDLDAAQALIDSLPASERGSEPAAGIAARLRLARAASEIDDPDALRERIEDHPDDLEARFRYSHYLSAQGDYEAAMEQLLAILAKDRNFADDAARKDLLEIFTLLGDGHPLTREGRRRLAMLMY